METLDGLLNSPPISTRIFYGSVFAPVYVAIGDGDKLYEVGSVEDGVIEGVDGQTDIVVIVAKEVPRA